MITTRQSKPRFSVVIPTYHRNDLLAKCLDRLAPNVQTLAADQYEVIVSDDGHESTAEDMIRESYPWVKWVAGPRKGPAANRNNGAKYAQGEWLVFTDDDCLPDPQWLAAYAESTKGTALALEGAIHPLGDLDRDMAECPVNMVGGYFWSANIAVQRTLFDQIGGFDANYPVAAHEDQDLKLRIDNFTEIIFVSDAIVVHPVRLISFKEAINRIHIRSIAFAYHANKNKESLGYENIIKFIYRQYLFLGRVLLHELKGLRFKNALILIIKLILGIPVSAFYFNKFLTN